MAFTRRLRRVWFALELGAMVMAAAAQSSAPGFSSIRDEAYQSLPAIIREGRRLALAEPRVDMPGAKIVPGASRQPFAPVPPERLPALQATVTRDGVVLSWERRADLAGLTFELHRSDKPEFTPNDGTRLVSLTRADYLDPAAPCGTWHYALVCVGDSQRSAPVRATATVPPNLDFPDVVSEDVRRFTALLASVVPDRRVEGLQGLADLKHWPAEDAVLPLLDDPSPEVRRDAVMTLGRLGGARSVAQLIALLDDPSWELRQHAWLSLCAMTAQHFGAAEPAPWNKWWTDSSLAEKEQALLRQAGQPAEVADKNGTKAEAVFVPTAPGRRARQRESVLPAAHPERRAALRALARLATREAEEPLLQLLQQPRTPPLDADERRFICEALERVGSARVIPVLAALRSDAAAWALGRIGGAEAERALLNFPKTLPVCLALDRLHSTNAGPFLVHLVGQMGQITYRGQPDDVMNEELQPIQRAGVNLIRRSGLAQTLIECVLQELEDTMKPPIAHGPRPPHPADWNEMFMRMRSELKPGFAREDGTTTSQPVVTMCYLLGGDGATSCPAEAAVVRRLIPLLHHPAVVPRVYVALALGRLQAREAAPAIVELIREGYPFNDSVALASGKHFEQSQTVRWRGFLCMALGRMGDEDAREALEELATDAKQPRDIRYGAVVGLRFIGSPCSLPALERAAGDDIIWLVRDEARRTMRNIEVSATEATR